jgi:hypothetical protein
MSASAAIRFLRPVPEAPGPARRSRAVSPAAVASVGLLDNSKDRVEILLAGLAEGLRAGRPGLVTLHWEKEHHSRRAPEPQLAECAARCQLAVLALAA